MSVTLETTNASINRYTAKSKRLDLGLDAPMRASRVTFA
jgi:hypothetical protein